MVGNLQPRKTDRKNPFCLFCRLIEAFACLNVTVPNLVENEQEAVSDGTGLL
jgi:hypothetical protein